MNEPGRPSSVRSVRCGGVGLSDQTTLCFAGKLPSGCAIMGFCEDQRINFSASTTHHLSGLQCSSGHQRRAGRVHLGRAAAGG